MVNACSGDSTRSQGDSAKWYSKGHRLMNGAEDVLLVSAHYMNFHSEQCQRHSMCSQQGSLEGQKTVCCKRPWSSQYAKT